MTIQATAQRTWPPIVVVIGLGAAALHWRRFSDPVRVFSTGPTLILGAALAVLLIGAAWAVRRQQADVTASHSVERSPPQDTGRGLRLAVGIVTVATVLLVGYHLAVPLAVAGSVRAGLFIATVTSFAAMAAVFTIAVQWENTALMDGGLGLLSLGICGLAVSAVPSYPASLAERYPVVLTAMVAGFALATWLCTRLGLHPPSGCIKSTLRRDSHLVPAVARTPILQSADSGGPGKGIPAKEGARRDSRTSGRYSLRHGNAFVVRWGAMDVAPLFKRFSFLNAALCILVAVLMSVWPRLRWIAIPDDSLGRVTAGFGVHLLLVLVLLWSGRRMNLITFHVLSIVAVVSSAGFMLVRAYPYTPQFQ